MEFQLIYCSPIHLIKYSISTVCGSIICSAFTEPSATKLKKMNTQAGTWLSSKESTQLSLHTGHLHNFKAPIFKLPL